MGGIGADGHIAFNEPASSLTVGVGTMGTVSCLQLHHADQRSALLSSSATKTPPTSSKYEITMKGPWLHHFRLPQTAHLGFIFVELPKLLRASGCRSLLKKAAIWGRFREKPETSPANGPADLVALLGAAKQRMEAYLMLEPEVYREIHESMEHHDYVSVKGEGYREGKAEVVEVTGLSLAEVTQLNDQSGTHQRG